MAVLSRAVLPAAGRAVALADNACWRSSEYREGLRCAPPRTPPEGPCR